MRPASFAAWAAFSVCIILAADAAAGVRSGEPLDPAGYGAGIVETLEAAVARDAHRAPAAANPKSRNGRHGEWVVPSPHATFYPCSGERNVVNEWGDTRMGIGFGRAVHVHGAFFAGQAGPGVWARRLRAHGFRRGVAVARSAWFEGVGEQARWFEINLYDVDRIEIEAEPAFGSSGWYGMDDLTYSVLGGDPGDAERVVTFDDCKPGTRLSATQYAGLDWELGRGPVELDAGMPLPKVPEQLHDAAGGAAEAAGGPSGGSGSDDGTPPTLLNDFQGVVRGDAGSSTFPPDTCGAVGPDHFVEAINRNFAIYDKSTGREISNILLGSFLPGSNGDPRVLYDQYSGRWVMIVTDFSADERIFLAVSLTSDPTGEWFKVDFETDIGADAGCWPDYPTLGVDAEGIYTAAYMVGCGMTLFAIDKAPLLDDPPSLGTVTAFRDLPFEGAIQPVHTYGNAAPGQYFVSRFDSDSLRVRLLQGPLSAPILAGIAEVPVPLHVEPPLVPALGSFTPLNTVDSRLMNAVYRDGSIWTAHTVEVGGRAACRWYEIDAQAATLVQWGTVQDDALHYFFPAVAVNASGDAVVGFSGANIAQYAAAYYTGRSALDPAGEMAPPALLKAGQAPQNNIDQFGRNRWGDYSSTTLDPADEHSIWTIQEYAHDEDIWGTWIGQLQPAEVCDGVAFCSDADDDGVRDDNCVWWACDDGSCTGLDVVFADMGGANGQCAPDGAADANDRFHALNCFSNQDTFGDPGYACETAPPAALNVDAGGALGACPSDGVCDANDAFHAINTFQGIGSCSCPLDGPAPATPQRPPVLHRADLRVIAARSDLRPGDLIGVDVVLDTALAALRGYQLHLEVDGGLRGTLELVDITLHGMAAPDLERAVRGTEPSDHSRRRTGGVMIRTPFAWSAFNLDTGQAVAGRDDAGVAVETGTTLATFTYRVSDDAAGRFVVELRHDPEVTADRTFLFATAPLDRFDVRSQGAVIDVAP